MAHVFHGDPARLDRPRRRKILPADALLKEIGLKQGDTALDFGAGIGYFSIPALDLVGPTGKVIAIDLSNEMLDELHRRAGDRPNLILHQGTDLGSWTADVILLIALLHEIDNPASFLTNCFTHLNPGGRIIVIDWQKKQTIDGPPKHHRIDKDEVLAMTNRPRREHPINRQFYFIEFW